MVRLLCFIALFALACSSKPPKEDTPKTEVVENVDPEKPAKAELEKHLDALWELNMSTYPTWATYNGDRRYDDRLTDNSDEARDQFLEELDQHAQKVAAIDPAHLSPMDQDTRRMVILRAKLELESRKCRSERWSVDGLGGPQVDFPGLPIFFPIRDQNDVGNLEKRYRATEKLTNQHIENLKKGLADGYSPTKRNTERAIAQLEKLIKTPIEKDPMLIIKPVEKEKTFDKSGLESAVKEVVRKNYKTYLAFLKSDVLPKARDKEVGLVGLPNGKECYAARMSRYIGDGFTPEELHQRGLDELKRMQEGMVVVGKELGLKNPTAADVIKFVQKKKTHFAQDEDDLLVKNRDVVARSKKAMPKFFGRLPQADVIVKPIEAHRAGDAPAAYYNGPPEDNSRPGIYYVNTAAPETRPLFNLEALAFHEAIPGHHLQIAIAKELPDVHIWRRNAGQTAYVEGWALYAELLADEMGLYSSPLTRFGMYNYQAWRAIRLVVDTGIHAMGWTRKQAIDFMAQNSAFPRSEVENEIDRYIAWPGQALAYMVGRMEIQRLRAKVEKEVPETSVAQFHDLVLGRGAVPLTILQENVDAFIEAKK